MVAPEGYDAGECPFVLGWADLFGICGGCPHEEVIVTVLDLLDCVGVVVAGYVLSVLASVLRGVAFEGSDVRCDGYVSTIDHGGPTVERIGVEGDVIAAAVIALCVSLAMHGTVKLWCQNVGHTRD